MYHSKGKCGLPSLDVAIVVESKMINTSPKMWETTSEFVGTFIKRISKTISSINTGLVVFNETGHYPLLNVSRNEAERAKGLLLNQYKHRQQFHHNSRQVRVEQSLEFAFNRFLTEEHNSFSAHKVIVAVTAERVTDDQYADIRRDYPDERIIFLNVVMKYTRQDVGVTDFGIEESLKSVYSVSELTELVYRIKQEARRLLNNKNSCFRKEYVASA